KDAVDIAPGLEAERGAFVIEQIELDVAPALDCLFFALGFGPRRVHPPTQDFRIDAEKRFTDIAGEGEILVPIAAVMMIVENTPDPARFAPMGQPKIIVAPFFVMGVETAAMGLACALHGSAEIAAVFELAVALISLRRIEVATAPEPADGCHDVA